MLWLHFRQALKPLFPSLIHKSQYSCLTFAKILGLSFHQTAVMAKESSEALNLKASLLPPLSLEHTHVLQVGTKQLLLLPFSFLPHEVYSKWGLWALRQQVSKRRWNNRSSSEQKTIPRSFRRFSVQLLPLWKSKDRQKSESSCVVKGGDSCTFPE